MLSNTPIEPSHFRRTLGNFCTGIVTITGYDDGVPVGFTAQSLVSLSLRPPLVGFSPSKTSETWPLLRKSGQFCVNILCEDQREICNGFARRAVDRFTAVDWRESTFGLPVIDGSLAYICCTLDTEYETGDLFLSWAKFMS
jgi:3-hydroxy-9,10-secoandrosta-1,3,5(10)-triene-9,17-dione monooxygenase reductase component